MYRCRACRYEEARGCLPSVSCGLYLLFLLGLTTTVMAGAVAGLRAWVGDRPAGDGPAETPWWLTVAALAAALVLIAIGVVIMNFALELVEYLAFARRRCPACGARRWSWGFTRGFGM